MAQTITDTKPKVLEPGQSRVAWHINPDGTRVEVPGSTIIHGEHVTIEPDVKLGFGVQIFGEVHLLTGAEIGNWCRIDGCTVDNSRLGDNTIAEQSSVKDSQIGEHNWIRPDSTILRDVISGYGATIGPNVIADDVEIKINEWYQG